MKPFFPLRKNAETLSARLPSLRAAALQTAFHVLHGPHPRRRAGGGESFWQFREYRPGDQPQAIDWRQSAKTDRVFVREKEQHKAQSIFFWVAGNQGMDFKSQSALPSKKEFANLLALTLALLYSREGEMIAYAGRQRPGHSEKTLQSFEHLLLETAEDTPASAALAAIPSHAGCYLLSDFLEPSETLTKNLAPLDGRTHNGWMLQILDPAEITLPYKGRMRFENMEGTDSHLSENAADIATAYNARILAHIEKIRDLCLKMGWRHRLCRTDEDPVLILRDLITRAAHIHKSGTI
ncbi:MAG: DUF58 domain-containing protein [Alphaproteobacteria bacterium]|nr:DUF58 domain-containing protein [Alphaproteobacteria bacterium]